METDMFALRTNEAGGFDPIRVARPEPGLNEVLINVAAIGINPADWKSLSAPPPGDGLGPEGAIMGWDLAGTVAATGPGVTKFQVGDRVFGMPTFPEFANSYAEYTVARARTIAKVPDGVATIEAGAVPLAGLTAWQALVDTMGIGRGDRLLIHAASGGVGHLAVQIAKARGAEVWGTASARNHEQLAALGADHLIDYRTQQFEDVATEMDGVLDLVGDGDTAERSVSCLRKGGKLVSISPMIPQAEVLEAAEISAAFVLVEPDYASLEALARLMSAGALQVVIAEQRPLAEMAELHDIGQKGSPLGKLVATVDAVE